MTKQYQINDTKTTDALELAVPASVSVAMDEIAADMREGLLALAVGAGLQVMQSLMEADVAEVSAPREHAGAVGVDGGAGATTWLAKSMKSDRQACMGWPQAIPFGPAFPWATPTTTTETVPIRTLAVRVAGPL